MKNQYTGDINDYVKYGLLRILSPAVPRLRVCWMLTQDEGRSDGQLVRYVSQPENWRDCDPELFDTLRGWLMRKPARGVHWIESSGILPSAVFYSSFLNDSAADRRSYFHTLKTTLRAGDLLFFDPDNGMEICSVRRGARGSSRYLYWDEARDIYEEGASVLIYQHFPRVSRGPFITRMIRLSREHLRPGRVMVFHTSRVMYLLCAHPEYAEKLERRCETLLRRWGGRIQVVDN